MTPNPFLDPARQGELYGHSSRISRRSNALLRAKITGSPVPETIARLAVTHSPEASAPLGLVADIGCGRGTSSRVLAEKLRPKRLVGIDASAALISEARNRVRRVPGTQVGFLQGDFHQLPMPGGSCGLSVAAFCLYHSCTPEQAVAEIARTLASDGITVLVTKSLDSYSELDSLLKATSLDPHAELHESLYTAAHGGNLAELAGTALDVVTVEHEEHRFRFEGLDHAAEYLATNPKYRLPPGLCGNRRALAAALHDSYADRPIAATSVITFVVARKRPGSTC